MKLQCSLCKEYKENNMFYTNKTPRGFDYNCKVCARIKRNNLYNPEDKKKRLIKTRYSDCGITEEDYQRLRVKQDFKCYICKKHESKCPKRTLAIDHSHKTNKVRGLLCNNCNVVLGLVYEDKNILLNLIKYLEEHA